MPLCVVTGGNRGIGLEVCRQLAAGGWDVVLGARDLAAGERAAAQAGATVRAVRLDVTSAEDVAALDLDRCDALVNNAAIEYDTDQRASSADLERIERAWQTNVLGAWRLTLALLPLLRASPHGRIVNVSSGGGALSDMGGGTPAYHVTKAALNALTRTLAGELRSDGVLVNAICPGWTATDMGGGGGRPVEQGAASVVWGVTLGDDGPTGGFFRDGRALDW